MKELNYKLPKSALALYVKLYCKKKYTSKSKQPNIITEATKSWVSLSKTEKQYFSNLFNEYKKEFRKKIALNLQSAQPYMKKKRQKTTRLCSGDKDLPTEQVNTSHSPSPCLDSNENQDNNICNNCTHSSNDANNETQHNNELLENCNTIIPFQNMSSTYEPEATRGISEPTPPLRSAMELFEIIKINEEFTENVKWTDLPRSQKQKYQRALLTIKNNYLNQYREYLEQLPLEQLFHYYKSKC